MQNNKKEVYTKYVYASFFENIYKKMTFYNFNSII